MPVAYPYDFWDLTNKLPSARAYHVAVQQDATLLVPLSLTRLRLHIRNDSAYTVYIGGKDGVNADNGWAIPAGDVFTTDTPYELWAICPSHQVSVQLLVEELAQVG